MLFRSFFWQGVLILAPMLVLAKLGALALSQDRRMAEHEAQLRAQDIAEEAAQAIWSDLQKFADPPSASASSPWGFVFSSPRSFYYSGSTKRIDLDRAGRLVFPVPYDSTPAPRPLDLGELSDVQRAAWDTARGKETDAPGSELLARDAAESFRLFLASSPPTNFAAVARFARGNLLAQAKDFPAAILEFAMVTNRFPDTFSEAGLPLDMLARFKIFEMLCRSGEFSFKEEFRDASDDLLRYAIIHPSAVTSEIFRRTKTLTNDMGSVYAQ